MSYILGARIQLESTSNIAEDSTMTRDFCATLNTTELERDVVVDIMFDGSQSSPFAQSSVFFVMLCYCVKLKWLF